MNDMNGMNEMNERHTSPAAAQDENEWLCAPASALPDDIARLKAAGYLKEAAARIDARLAEDWAQSQNGGAQSPAANPAPHGVDAQRAALLAVREVLRRLPADYPYTEEAAVARMQGLVRGFTAEELRALERDGRVDWRFIEGEKRYFARFDETLLDTDPAFAARRLAPGPDADARRARRRALHDRMARTGQAAARITLEASIRMSDDAFAAALARARQEGRRAVHLRVWLPLPAACPAQSGIRLEWASEPPARVAPETAPQRTVYWEADLAENRAFAVRYSYTRTARYADPMGFAPDPVQPAFDTGEQAPHILFTPALRALAAQLTAGVSSPAEKARRFYDYITLNVRYHYQPAYFVLEDIPTRCAADRRGDCGVMALTFITLCRLAGIPARWESGLAAGPDSCGCHDWAAFYIAPKGWMYADCSYGAAMARAGDEELRRHYFGSLDPDRMAANTAFGAPFDPPMRAFRADPWDNQTGEMEADGVGLWGGETLTDKRTISYQEL